MEQADLAQRCLHSCQINPGMRLKRNSEEVPLNLESWACEMFFRLSVFLIQWPPGLMENSVGREWACTLGSNWGEREKREFGFILENLCQLISIFIIFHPHKYNSHLSSEQGKWSLRSLCILPSWNESVGWVQKSILQDIHKPEHGQWNVIRTASGRVLGGWWSQEQRSSSIIVYRPRLWDNPEKSPIQASTTQGSWHLFKVFPLFRISSFFSFQVQNSTHFFLASSWQWNWPWTVTARYSEWSSCIIQKDGMGGFQEGINICQVGKGIFLYPVPIYWAPTVF